MKRSKSVDQAARAAQAIDRVLGAERDAEAALAQARLQAQDTLAQARQDALAEVNRVQDRVAAWQVAHAAALAGRLAVLRAQAQTSADHTQPPDEAAIGRAVARVAARLTGGSPAGGPDGPA